MFGLALSKKLLEDLELKRIVKELTMHQALGYVCQILFNTPSTTYAVCHVSVHHVVKVCKRRIVKETLVAWPTGLMIAGL